MLIVLNSAIFSMEKIVSSPKSDKDNCHYRIIKRDLSNNDFSLFLPLKKLNKFSFGEFLRDNYFACLLPKLSKEKFDVDSLDYTFKKFNFCFKYDGEVEGLPLGYIAITEDIDNVSQDIIVAKVLGYEKRLNHSDVKNYDHLLCKVMTFNLVQDKSAVSAEREEIGASEIRTALFLILLQKNKNYKIIK